MHVWSVMETSTSSSRKTVARRKDLPHMKRIIEGTLRLVVRSSLWTLAVVLLVTAAEAQAAPNSRKMLVSSNIRASNLPQEESSAQAGISFEFSAVPLADALDVIA